jgi:response regulator RpfG family c-di-GMP phosphodiesterase
MEGTDLLVKAKKEFQQTVKIIITGCPSIETGTKALNEDAAAYLSKPVKPSELLEIIDEQFYDASLRANLNNQCLV